MQQKLTLVTLGVKDLVKAAKFYIDGLGWVKSDLSQGDLIMFNLGGIHLSLYPLKALEDDTTLEYEASRFNGITLSHNVESEILVDQILEQVAKLGATIIKPAQKVFWGGYSGYFKDLDGHLFEVAYNPHWQYDL